MLALGWAACLGTALAQDSSEAAQQLRAKNSALGASLQHNVFAQPLVLVSQETTQGLRGDMYALVGFPFANVSSALQDPQQWCEVMILHLNTKYCHTFDGAQGQQIQLNIGSKSPQTLSQSSRVTLAYTLATSQPDYFEVQLSASEGPMGTRDYQIRLEAVALATGQTFLHLTYAYSANLAARLAMQTYLATVGSNKVGFTVLSQAAQGPPVWIKGVRALVERNTMRYYLAINSYLATREQPATHRFEASLQHWFSASEAYPEQLHEIERPAYLTMKRAEHLRQQTVQ
nr:hypothetical protein [Rhodoferax sp. U11-2br]